MSNETKDPYDLYELNVSRIYNIYINKQIYEADRYTDMINLIRNASQYDMINLYINSPGGNLYTGLQIINAMKDSQAHVRTILDGVAMSLAPLILFAGNDIVVNENTMIMFHDFSSIDSGKGSEMLSSAEAHGKFYKELLLSYAYPFLSEIEIENITKGIDVYFDYDEIVKRLDAVVKMREKEEKEQSKNKVVGRRGRKPKAQ